MLAERAPASLKTMGLVEPPGARGGKRRRGLVGIATYLWYASVRNTCSQTALISRAYTLRGMFPAIKVRAVWQRWPSTVMSSPPSYKKVGCQRRARKIRICLTRAKEMRSLVNTCSCRHQQKLASIFPVGFTRKEIRNLLFSEIYDIIYIENERGIQINLFSR